MFTKIMIYLFYFVPNTKQVNSYVIFWYITWGAMCTIIGTLLILPKTFFVPQWYNIDTGVFAKKG